MDFINRDKIIDKINACASDSIPFLFAVNFAGEQGFVLRPGEAENSGIYYSILGFTNIREGVYNIKKNIGGQVSGNQKIEFEIFPAASGEYQVAFEKTMFHLKRGDTYLLNLTFPTPITTNLTAFELFRHSVAPYKLMVPGRFIVFSPEPFVKIENGIIRSNPMKGTIDASLPDAEKTLLSDKKEMYEHNTIVDLIRNDLSMVATHVKVNRFRYLELIRTHRGNLWQMSSEISGKLPEKYLHHLGEIIFTLLPAGSVTGAPKERTVQIIRETETYDRGFYTGIFGYFDGKSLHTAVAIRFIELSGGTMVFKSGGGITALSNLNNEYQELLKKVYVPIV